MIMKHLLTFLLFLSSALGLSAANPSFTDMFNAHRSVDVQVVYTAAFGGIPVYPPACP
jgi:hypothetical protein